MIEVWKMIASSVTTKSMAEKLGCSPKTVEYHRVQLMHRLGIFDVAGLTREAIKRGLVKL
jgi:DNA-binding CsgD family transcriptional regulator